MMSGVDPGAMILRSVPPEAEVSLARRPCGRDPGQQLEIAAASKADF